MSSLSYDSEVQNMQEQMVLCEGKNDDGGIQTLQQVSNLTVYSSKEGPRICNLKPLRLSAESWRMASRIDSSRLS